MRPRASSAEESEKRGREGDEEEKERNVERCEVAYLYVMAGNDNNGIGFSCIFISYGEEVISSQRIGNNRSTK